MAISRTLAVATISGVLAAGLAAQARAASGPDATLTDFNAAIKKHNNAQAWRYLTPDLQLQTRYVPPNLMLGMQNSPLKIQVQRLSSSGSDATYSASYKFAKTTLVDRIHVVSVSGTWKIDAIELQGVAPKLAVQRLLTTFGQTMLVHDNRTAATFLSANLRGQTTKTPVSRMLGMQNVPQSFAFVSLSASSSSATATVKYLFAKGSVTDVLHIVKQGLAWRIDGITRR